MSRSSWTVPSSTAFSLDLQSCISDSLLDMVPSSAHIQVIKLIHKSSTSCIFSVLASDPIILSGAQLQTCGVNFFYFSFLANQSPVQLDFFTPIRIYCSLTSFFCFPSVPMPVLSEHSMPRIASLVASWLHSFLILLIIPD